jgi:hypothetical protein
MTANTDEFQRKSGVFNFGTRKIDPDFVFAIFDFAAMEDTALYINQAAIRID